MEQLLRELRFEIEERRDALGAALAELRFERACPKIRQAIEVELRICDGLLRPGWRQMSGLTALRLSQWLCDTKQLANEADQHFEIITTSLINPFDESVSP